MLNAVGIEAAYSSSPPHRRLATIVADPTIISPTSMLSPQYGLTVWAPEALVVLVVVEPVAVLVPVEVAELEVGAAVAGKEESFASVYNDGLMVSDSIYTKTSNDNRESRLYSMSQGSDSDLKKGTRTVGNTHSVLGGQASHVLADTRGRDRTGDEVDSRTL